MLLHHNGAQGLHFTLNREEEPKILELFHLWQQTHSQPQGSSPLFSGTDLCLTFIQILLQTAPVCA